MLDKIKDNWTNILNAVRDEQELSDVSFNTWLAPLEPIAFDDGVLTVLFPGDVNGIGYIEHKYRIFIKFEIEEITGIRCNLSFVTPSSRSKADTGKKNKPLPSFTEVNLNPRYTFENFVVGNSNQFAHAAALAVAETPSFTYNPLFIWGGVGLGKTHLIQSIAHFIIKTNPSARVVYVTCETFTNELIEAIRNKNNITTTEFREKYRTADVLLIDDIQFISNKESTQEEIFHTFNTLYEAKKQIVFASDRPPGDIEALEERLSSRFKSGLTVSISSPDYETRMAILRSKEEMEGYNIDNEVIKFIATNIKSNIRELEGALTNIVALSRLTKKEITVELTREALKDQLSPNSSREITPELIIEIVSDHYKLRPTDICSEKRTKDIVIPRQVVMYLCREMTNAPLQQIAKYLCKKDHSTILHGCDKISAQIDKDEALKHTVDIIRKKINPG